MNNHYIILIDVSYSMSSHIHKFVLAINKFLHSLKQQNRYNNTYITVGQFSHHLRFICECKNINEIDYFDIKDFTLDGTTALYDAIYKTIKLTKDIPANTNMFIITDGDDTCSFYATKDDIDIMMNKMIEENKWNIIHCNVDMNTFNVPTIKYDMAELSDIFDKINLYDKQTMC